MVCRVISEDKPGVALNMALKSENLEKVGPESTRQISYEECHSAGKVSGTPGAKPAGGLFNDPAPRRQNWLRRGLQSSQGDGASFKWFFASAGVWQACICTTGTQAYPGLPLIC